MKLTTLSWTDEHFAETLKHAEALVCRFCTLCVHAPHWLGRFSAGCKLLHLSRVNRSDHRATSAYVMLVESDVQEGIRGIIP